MFSGLGYEKAKVLAKQLYSEIEVVYCPLLDDDIHFTSEGFNHLIRKGRKQRTKERQIERFELIPYLSSIIGDPKADIHLDLTSSVKIWNVIKTIQGDRIRVIISQPGLKKMFVSVYPPINKKSHKM